jgi:hypothetical protein
MAGCVVLTLLAAVAFAEAAPPPPAAIRPPKGLVLLFRARAEGVQIYECKAAAGAADRFEWVLKAPQAELFDDRGDKLGTHGAGPVWEAADGSKVRGKLKAQSPAPDTNAIPWLLIEAAGHEGKGLFSGVRYIQRVDTWAGRAPVAKCGPADAGKQVRVKYQATYLFYGEKP